MVIGIPTELKSDEYRVGLTPAGVRELAARGHSVIVEAGAGAGSAFSDEHYRTAGASLASAEDVWASADLILKVKEPLPEEFGQLRGGQVLFTYLHLAADRELTLALRESGVVAIAYETVQSADGMLPLLAPMSEVAGRLAPQAGAWALERHQGGRGVLLGGIPGVLPGRVVVVGGGTVGMNAAMIALGMRADVLVLERSVERMRALEMTLEGRVRIAMSNRQQLEEAISSADLVIGAVLIPGARAPKLVTREMLGLMRSGSVVVDVAIDQGGCFETSRPTTHSDPIYETDQIVHYCVANMPGSVPVTSTKGLTNVTLPYVEAMAELGVVEALRRDASLRSGVNVAHGAITHPGVAAAHDLDAAAPADVLGL